MEASSLLASIQLKAISTDSTINMKSPSSSRKRKRETNLLQSKRKIRVLEQGIGPAIEESSLSAGLFNSSLLDAGSQYPATILHLPTSFDMKRHGTLGLRCITSPGTSLAKLFPERPPNLGHLTVVIGEDDHSMHLAHILKRLALYFRDEADTAKIAILLHNLQCWRDAHLLNSEPDPNANTMRRFVHIMQSLSHDMKLELSGSGLRIEVWFFGK